MKKSSKKFAALVTLAAFMLTLVPMAAFAANPVDPQASFFLTAKTNADNADVAVNDVVEAEVDLKDVDEAVTTASIDMIVWAKDANGNVTSALDVVGGAADDNLDTTYARKLTGVDNDTKIELKFKRSGTYTLFAAIAPTAPVELKDLTKLQAVADHQVVVVKAEAGKVTKLSANGTALANDAETPLGIAVEPNGLEEAEIVLVATDDDGKAVANKEIKLSTSSAYAVLDKDTVTTDFRGKATVKYSATRIGDYKIYADVDDFKGIMLVGTVGASEAATITTIKTPAAPFENPGVGIISDDIKFEIADKNGTVLTDAAVIAGEPAANKMDPKHSSYVKVVAQPAGANLKADAFVLAADGDDGFTLASTVALAKEGKYTVRVALKSGKTAEVSFEIKKFGTAKELKIVFDSETVALGKKFVEPTIKLVDANGVEREVKSTDEVTFGYNGYAIENFNTSPVGFRFDVKADEKYIGQTVKFTAVSEKLGLVGTAEVVVAQDGKSIKFDSEKGLAGKDNKVIATTVDGAGKAVAVMPAIYSTVQPYGAYVAKSSNPDAKVTAEVVNINDLQTKGEFELKLTSNKDTTAEIVVYVKGFNGNIYANTLNYTFGKESTAANQHVVMVINSKDTIVNNKIVAIDAAPYIKENRTFVPIRALVEDFGAKVEWNGDKQEVTVELEGNKVVMTIGSKDFTFNGEKKTMDVAPEIKADRTFVPVRFVAEAFGFTVTPIYNTDGTTASVVFTK